MEREACVCDHGFERSDLCAEIIIIIIIIIISSSLNYEIRLHGRRGNGMAVLLARKIKARTAERWMRNPVRPSSCVTPAGTSNELDVQNEWEENTHTHKPGASLNNGTSLSVTFSLNASHFLPQRRHRLFT